MFRQTLATILLIVFLTGTSFGNTINILTSQPNVSSTEKQTYCGVTTFQIADYVRAIGYEPLTISPYGECDALVRTNSGESLHIFIESSTVVGAEVLPQ